MKPFLKLLNKSEPVGVAVSGGVDSVAGAVYLHLKGYNISILHFNHKLREQNDAMESSVRNLANYLRRPYISSFRTKPGVSETKLRECRFEFFRNSGYSQIVTCHHVDDFIESYLMNCFRGHPEHMPIPLESDFFSFKVLHPFLCCKKSDLQRFVNKLPASEFIVEDETNVITKGSRRNFIRHEIIPKLAEKDIHLYKYSERRLANEFSKYLNELEVFE